jgi:hypothetical protein
MGDKSKSYIAVTPNLYAASTTASSWASTPATNIPAMLENRENLCEAIALLKALPPEHKALFQITHPEYAPLIDADPDAATTHAIGIAAYEGYFAAVLEQIKHFISDLPTEPDEHERPLIEW